MPTLPVSTRWSLALFGGLVLLLFCAGCGGSEELAQVATVPVEGTITFNGKPYTKRALIYFEPTRGNPSKYVGFGMANGRGSYSITITANWGHSIERMVAARKRGLPPGWYRVRIDGQEAFDADRHHVARPDRVPRRWFLPQRYSRFETSRLQVQVIEAPAAGAYDFHLAD